MSANVRTKLHSIVDNMSNKLKLDLDDALNKLLTISDEYDETNRIIMTLPCVRKLVSNSGQNVTFVPKSNISDALLSLMDYKDVDEDVDEPEVKIKVEPEVKIKTEVNVKSEVKVETEVSTDVEVNEEVDLDDSDCESSTSEHEVEFVKPSEGRVEIIITEIGQDDEEEGQEDVVQEVQDNVEDDEEEEDDDEEEEEDEEDEEVEEEEDDNEVAEEEVVEEDDEVEEDEDNEEVEEDDEVEEDEDNEVVEDDEVVEVEDEDKDNEVEVEEDEEESVFEIEIDDKTYYTTNTTNGDIYEADENGDPGEKVGEFVDSEPVFSNQ
jgi:hypothetical protein